MKLFQPSPIEFGQIKKIWSDSYHGQKSYFLNNQTIIYACDSVIKLYDTETKESKRFHPFGEGEKANENGICLLTANSAIGKFAFSEIHLSPKVYVYSYEQNAIKEQTKLLDGAVLEYLAIEFSNSEAILTLSGIPDQQIIVWSWKTGKRLVNINLKASLGRPEDLSFCPTNWRRLTVAYKSELNVWNLDQFDSDRIKSFNQRFVFPVTDDSVDEEQVAPEFKEEFESSKLAITGLNEAYKENIEDILDKRKRHQFSCLCWLSNDEVLVSTQANYIFRYNLSSSTVKCVFKPHQNSLDDERFIIESDHLITKLYLHRQGLFALCIDNNLRVLEGNELVPLKDKQGSSETLVKKIINTSADKIANLSFNTKYTSLAISTNRGIELLDCARLFENEADKEILNLELDFNNHAMSQEDSRLGLAVNFDYGRVVGADTIVGLNNQQFYLVLKEFGTIQVWSLEDSRIVNRLNLNQKSSCLAAHPYMPLVVVGTDEGRLVFIDFSNQLYPRVLEVCNLHRNVVRLLKFNSSGTILFSVGDDKKIFLIDVSLSNRVEPLLSKLDQRLQTVYKKPLGFEPGFYVLGYLEFEGEAVCIDTFDYDESQGEKKIITRVAVGVHDPNNWEITKKNLAESALNMSMSNNPIAPSGDQPASVTQTLVVQNAQTSSTISRMQYSHLSSEPDFIKWDEDASSNRVKLASRVLLFEISYKLISDKAVYNTSKLDLKDELINRSAFHTQYLFSDLVLTARNYLVIFSERFLIKMLIPDMEPAKKILNKLNYLEFSEVIGSHDFGYGRLSKTTNNQIILSGGYDGSIQIRKAIDLTPFNEFRATSFTNGGIEIVKLSEFDKKSIITIGFDNTVFKLEWNCQNDHTTKIARSECLKGDFNPEALKNLKSEENPNPGYETWFEIKEAEFFKQQDSQYLPKKKEILNGLTEIKKRINELMSVNQSRDELSKLKEHEFYLDLEELERLHKEADSEILQIREKTDFENTAKLFVREKIKGECWEDMKVKGRGISAFNSNLLVENYPLKEKSKEEQQLLDRIKIIRTIEMKIQKTRSELTHDIMRRENINELFEADEDDSNEGGQQQQQVSNYTNPNLAQLSYKGSISSLFNGDSPLLYNQFELYAREQKWIQISLIQECIGKIKENFNKEFETVMQRKVQEIARIKEKNLRLKQIYSDLNEEKQLDEPILGDSENPESLFQVKDEEIKVEKYLSPEQKRLLEEQLAEEARRRELERLDNWRERGLMDMMGGVLQIRREDELKKDVPIPSFVKEKPQEEWTLEEQAQYQQYEKKVQELNEERVKLRKQLNVEINKINEQILECYQNFDNALFSLHQRKVKTQQAIFQEELKIVRLVNSLIVDLELETYNTQINERLERSKKEKNELNDEIQQVKKSIEAFKVEYEILSAQDKAQEKAFIREFADVSSAMRDQLLKLFRKRPKQRIVVNKTILSPHPMQIAELGSENNPFADRPSTAQQQLLSEAELNAALADLDHIDNGPPGVDIGLWSRFVEFRRAKIALENSMRMKAINLNEMMLYLQKRAEDDEAKRREIEELARNALNIQTLRLKASHNLQVQLLLKQGQVEIDPGPYVHNMEHCLLIDRKEVESLNKIIQDHGKQKIAIMIDSKNYRKGIRQFEWEHKKMKMTIEDYIQKQRDITYLKLTREVQEFLNSENYDGKKQQEISTLEQTIAYKKEQYARIYANQNKKLKGVRDQSVKVANNNLTLDDELKDKNVVLYERKHVENEMTGKTSETLRNERFQQIIQRRKLVDLAKAQAQEVAFLRSEVERLRMKTFPALVQIEF